MKKILKQNKGFSLVELLIALLIMAVIAGTAITLFGGVLETSKGGADRETAESIKRAILTYMNASNDTKLNALNKTSDTTLISSLSKRIEITDDGAGGLQSSVTSGTTIDISVVKGTFGPFLERENIKPTQDGKTGWTITVDPVTQIISVEATSGGSLTVN